MKHASDLSKAELQTLGRAAGREAVSDSLKKNVPVVGESHGRITRYYPKAEIQTEHRPSENVFDDRRGAVEYYAALHGTLLRNSIRIPMMLLAWTVSMFAGALDFVPPRDKTGPRDTESKLKHNDKN